MADPAGPKLAAAPGRFIPRGPAPDPGPAAAAVDLARRLPATRARLAESARRADELAEECRAAEAARRADEAASASEVARLKHALLELGMDVVVVVAGVATWVEHDVRADALHLRRRPALADTPDGLYELASLFAGEAPVLARRREEPRP